MGLLSETGRGLGGSDFGVGTAAEGLGAVSGGLGVGLLASGAGAEVSVADFSLACAALRASRGSTMRGFS